jgi:hypothetical protein
MVETEMIPLCCQSSKERPKRATGEFWTYRRRLQIDSLMGSRMPNPMLWIRIVVLSDFIAGDNWIATTIAHL